MGYAQAGHGDHHPVKGRAAGTVLLTVGCAEKVIECPEKIHAQPLEGPVAGTIDLQPGDLVHDQRDAPVFCVPYDLRIKGEDALHGRALADPGDAEDGKTIRVGMVPAGIVQAPIGYGSGRPCRKLGRVSRGQRVPVRISPADAPVDPPEHIHFPFHRLVDPDDPLGKQLPAGGRAFPVIVRIGRPYHEFCDGVTRFKRCGYCFDKRYTDFLEIPILIILKNYMS